MSTVIRSGRREIWEALVTPDRRTRWGPLAFETSCESGGYPEPGHAVRWRCRLGRIPVELLETPLAVTPGERLRTALGLGPLHLEQVFTLRPEPGAPGGTRLHLKLVAPNAAPVVGGLMDRFEVREFVTELAAGVLAAVQEALEADRSPPRRRAPTRRETGGRLRRGPDGLAPAPDGDAFAASR